MLYYVLVDIGCIECGEESRVIGIFTDKETAKANLKKFEELQANNWHGQHSFEIFVIDELNKVYEPKY